MFPPASTQELEQQLAEATGLDRAELLLRLAWEIRVLDPERAAAAAVEICELAEGARTDAGSRRAASLVGRAEVLAAWILVRQGAFADGLAGIERARAALTGCDDPLAEALCLNVCGEVHYYRRDLDRARAAFDGCLQVELPGGAESDAVRIRLQTNLGRTHFERCEYPRALELFLDALQVSQRIGDRLTEGLLRMNVGNVLSEVGDLEGSLEFYRAALAIHRERGDRSAISLVLSNLGSVLVTLDDHEEVLRLCDEALELGEGLDAVPHALVLRARALSALGRHDEARASAERCLELQRSTDNRCGEAEVLARMGELAAARDEIAEALALYEAALAIPEHSQDPMVRVIADLGIAGVRLGAGSPEEALAVLRPLLDCVSLSGEPELSIKVLRWLSEAHEALGEHRQALVAFRELRRLERDLFREGEASRLEALRVMHELANSRHRENTLRQVRDELEDRVARRTVELERSNVDLERALRQRSRAEEEQARLEEELRHAQKMEAVGRLAGGMAHDFNNLLTVIRGYGEFLLEDLVTEGSERTAAQEILHASERAARLTSQLLAFSRKRPVRPEVVDVDAHVAELQTMLGRLVGERVRLEVQRSGAVQAVEIDPSQLEQVVVNLVVNASDAMPDGGAVTLSIDRIEVEAGELRRGEYVRLQVRDTGTGMDPATQRLIFDPFFTTKGPGRGTGLGLSTVYGIVRQGGGVVRVSSAPTSGTTFEILLPCSADAPRGVEPTPPVQPLRDASLRTLLLVEDEESVRDLVRQALLGWGFRVLLAEDGQEAIEVAEATTEPIDLVVSDVVMPRLHGPDLMEALLRDRPDLRFVFTSGYPDGAGSLPPGKRHVYTFLQKPFTMSELHARIAELLPELVGPA